MSPRPHRQTSVNLSGGATARDFASSNATSNMFLGGRSKSWMTGAPAAPPATVPASSHREPQRTRSPKLQQNAIRIHSWQTPSTSTSPQLPNAFGRPKPIQTRHSAEADSVLPSPAPSEENGVASAAAEVAAGTSRQTDAGTGSPTHLQKRPASSDEQRPGKQRRLVGGISEYINNLSEDGEGEGIQRGRVQEEVDRAISGAQREPPTPPPATVDLDQPTVASPQPSFRAEAQDDGTVNDRRDSNILQFPRPEARPEGPSCSRQANYNQSQPTQKRRPGRPRKHLLPNSDDAEATEVSPLGSIAQQPQQSILQGSFAASATLRSTSSGQIPSRPASSSTDGPPANGTVTPSTRPQGSAKLTNSRPPGPAVQALNWSQFRSSYRPRQPQPQPQTQMTPAPVLQGTEQPNHIFNKDRCAQLITHFVHPNGSGFPRPLSQQEHARINLLQRACLRQDITFLLTHQIYCLATYDAFSLPQQLQTAPYLGALCQKLDSILMPNNQLTWPVLGWFATFPAPLKDVTQSAPELYGSKLKLFESFASHTASNWERLKTICDERGYPPLVGEIMNYLGANSAVLQHVVFLSITRSLWGMDETPWFREAERLFFKNQDEWNKALSHHINGTMDPQIVTKYNMWYISRYITLFHLHKGSITPEIAFQQLGSNDFQSSPFADLISTGPRARPIVPSNVPVQGPAFDGRIATAPAGAIQAAANTAGRNQPQFRGSAIHAQGPVQHFHAQLPPNVPQQSFETQIQITTPINAHAQQIHQSPPVPLPIRPGALLPPPGFLRNQQVQPDPSLSSLHLAHLRSPILKAKEMSADPSAPKPKLFQFVRSVQPRFALELPICKKQYQFDVSDNDSLIPKDTPSDLGEPPTRTITPNSVIFRLRCCKRQGFGVGQLKDESAWVVSDTVWPPFFYFSMNGTILEPRKKLHYAKDHPIDLTPYVKPGNNTVEVSANVCKDDHSPLAYLFAVEVLSVTTQENIRAHCNAHVIPANESIDAIKKSLAGNDDDDDLAIVSSNLSITLFDPFIGCKIFDTPVRGTRCLHRNCFDLETFLATRKCVKGADSPSKVDVWACPICKADARPQSLVVDGFLVQVRKELEAQGELETRAIIVEQDGSWKPKAEKESGSGDVPSRGRSEASKTPAVGMDRRDSIRAEAATASGGVAVRTPTKEKVLEIIDLGGDSSDAEMAAAA